MTTHDDNSNDPVKRVSIPPITLPRPITPADVARLKTLAKRGRRAEEAVRRLERRKQQEQQQQKETPDHGH